MASESKGDQHVQHDQDPRQSPVALGRRLRCLRESRHLSLRAAASISGVSPSYISLVERGETEIGFRRLTALIGAYGIDFTELFAQPLTPPLDFVPFSKLMKVKTGVRGVELYHVMEPSWSLHPFLMKMEPGTNIAGIRHREEEFLHCVKGTPTIAAGELLQKMEPGDTLWIRPSVDHAYLNNSDSPAILVGAYVPHFRTNSD